MSFIFSTHLNSRDGGIKTERTEEAKELSDNLNSRDGGIKTEEKRRSRMMVQWI